MRRRWGLRCWQPIRMYPRARPSEASHTRAIRNLYFAGNACQRADLTQDRMTGSASPGKPPSSPCQSTSRNNAGPAALADGHGAVGVEELVSDGYEA